MDGEEIEITETTTEEDVAEAEEVGVLGEVVEAVDEAQATDEVEVSILPRGHLLLIHLRLFVFFVIRRAISRIDVPLYWSSWYALFAVRRAIPARTAQKPKYLCCGIKPRYDHTRSQIA